MMSDQVKKLCHELRLFGMHAHVERRSEEATASQLHPLEFLRLLLDDEAISRRDRIGKTLTTRAKFRFAAELEDWDTSYSRGLTKAQLRELAQLDFFHRQENLRVFGKTGEGKTYLGIAIGRRLCQQGFQTIFMPVNALFEEVGAAKAAGKYLGFVRHLARAKALMLDDFGLRGYSHDEGTVLLDLLEERYRKGSVIVTSQVDSKAWAKLFEDPVIGEAIVDRLLHPSKEIVLTGGSYRERLAKNRG
jgi:DNA replication protein DnaC